MMVAVRQLQLVSPHVPMLRRIPLIELKRNAGGSQPVYTMTLFAVATVVVAIVGLALVDTGCHKADTVIPAQYSYFCTNRHSSSWIVVLCDGIILTIALLAASSTFFVKYRTFFAILLVLCTAQYMWSVDYYMFLLRKRQPEINSYFHFDSSATYRKVHANMCNHWLCCWHRYELRADCAPDCGCARRISSS
jgi:heme/copper-type cytochrome/quinol oxidase subunit 4